MKKTITELIADAHAATDATGDTIALSRVLFDVSGILVPDMATPHGQETARWLRAQLLHLSNEIRNRLAPRVTL